MTIRRRTILGAAALGPFAAALPGLTATAGAAGTPLGPLPTTLDGSGLAGFSLSWVGDPDPGVVAQVRALVDGQWLDRPAIRSDHDHGPADPGGRVHSTAVIDPDADAWSISPVTSVDDLRRHDLADSIGPLRPQADGLTTIEPIPGLSIIERSNWTTRGRLDTIDCTLGSSVSGLGCRVDVSLRHAVVHHTVNANGYSQSSVPGLLRGIQRYHMDTRGWDDIAYNFVIDRFGGIWHARDGDPHEPITGGHTLGFNAESLGVAILGDFQNTNVPSSNVDAIVDSLGMLLGWKLGRHGVDPRGRTVVRSSGGDRDAFEKGAMVEVANLGGHREFQYTSCPGSVVYNRLGEVRAAAAELVPVFGRLDPAYHLDRVDMAGWAIERFSPTAAVSIDISVDGGPPTTLAANTPTTFTGDTGIYADAGPNHGFHHVVPIDLDTTSITVTARAGDGRTASLMDLRLFATFIDVEPYRFFSNGVYWLREKELTTGTLPGLFEPMDEVTRAQMATFLHRFMDRPAPAGPSPFTDVVPTSFYETAVDWLYGAGITTGTSATEFSPKDIVTRGQMATFLWRLCGTPDAPVSPFLDARRGKFYDRAIHWLFAMGITVGTSPTEFSPDDTITRGEMATFLHRLATTPEAWSIVDPPSVVEV